MSSIKFWKALTLLSWVGKAFQVVFCFQRNLHYTCKLPSVGGSFFPFPPMSGGGNRAIKKQGERLLRSRSFRPSLSLTRWIPFLAISLKNLGFVFYYQISTGLSFVVLCVVFFRISGVGEGETGALQKACMRLQSTWDCKPQGGWEP